MIDKIREVVNRWTHGEDWRTWVAHSVFALLIALIFHELGWLGWQVAIGYYLIREIEQIFYAWVSGKPIKWFDSFMDVAVPTVVVLIAAWIWQTVAS